MELTQEQLTAALEANPELETVLVDTMKARGRQVFTNDEYNSAIANVIALKTKEHAENIEKDVQDLFGIKKAFPEEKYYDLVKRAVKETNDAHSAKIAELESKIAAGSNDEILKNELATLKANEKGYKQQLEKYEKEIIPGLNNQIQQTKLSSIIEAAFNGLEYDKGQSEAAINALKEQVKASMLSNIKVSGKDIIFVKDGVTVMDGTNIAGAAYMAKQGMQSVLAKASSGGGSNPPETGTDTGIKDKTGKNIIIPGNVKTKVQLHSFLSSQGLTANSKEFIELFEKHGESLPLR